MSRSTVSAEWEIREGTAARSIFDADWDALARQNPHATAFQSAAWHLAWTGSVAAAEGKTPVVIRFLVDGKPAAAIALQYGDRDGVPVVSPLTSPWADYHDAVGMLAAEPVRHLVPQAVAAVARAHGGRVELTEVIRGGLLDQVLPAQLVRHRGTPVFGIDLTCAEHLRRVAETKEHVVKERRLARIGEVTCRHFTAADEIESRFDGLVGLHRRQWEGRSNAVAPFDNDVERGFRALIRHMAPAGQIVLTEFRVGGSLLASYFGLRWKHWYGAYRTAYDATFRRYSPGHLMLRAMIRDFADTGVTILDLTRGSYPYKEGYANRAGHNTTFEFHVQDIV
ncbi:GNAT family N-acetyltransferase [Paractinoplanes rishiriensis]|uniref:BioF2-like acetyltransferase domain-containing protein n=1 Tax=Paractinoplanes rishiriensis TaxID=1050105 RepID=A0A919JXQ4_9ACTN|nr:GNAT family N-acetyltransferase [Actinoplanes rishiriensis]GIE95217.1 hypothetical protein Ari01nite_26820 [Actinoplanes rishiriensis]